MTARRPGARSTREQGLAHREEILFFRSIMGWSETRIAERLGLTWDSYTQYLRRHPELRDMNEYTFEIEEQESA
jgi:hypothetical protein